MSIDFDEFVRTHTTRLRAIVARMPGRGGTEVDDLVQEALARAYEKRHTFVSEQHALNWACHVVRCLLVDEQRSWYRRNVVANPDAADTVPAGADPADLVVRSDDCRLAVRSLAGLPVAHRQLLWDHVVEGESYADIARRTATPLATVRSTAHRARAAAVRHFRQAGGLLAGVTPPLRPRWSRLRLPALPAEGVAAGFVAVGLLFAATPGAVPAVPAVPVTEIRAAAAVPAPVTPPERPGAVEDVAGTRVAAAPADRPAPAPSRDSSPPYREVEFMGDHASRCSYTPAPSGTWLYETHRYDCTLAARSTSCGTYPTRIGLGCRVELVSGVVHGTMERHAGDLVCRARAERHDESVGVVEYVDGPGSAPIRIPVEIGASYQRVTMTGGVKIDGRYFHVYAEMPFPCEEETSGPGFRGHTTYGAPRNLLEDIVP